MSSDLQELGIDRAKLPALQRPREPREPLLDPGKLRLILVLAVGVVVVAALLVAAVIIGATATVPDLVGLQETTARANVQRRKLTLEVSQRLYSPRPKGTVLSQSPRPGSRMRTGRAVVVSISGGTQQVIVPDLSGMSRKKAVAQLEGSGLLVSEISEVSQNKAGTVVSTSPGPGTRLQIGDTIIVHIAQATDVITLSDYDLSGQTVAIEPQYCGKVTSIDVTYDIAQRLSALVQAAGGTPVITRSSTETTISPAVYAQRAQQAHPTASVLIEVDGVDSSALVVSARQQNGSLGQALFNELKWLSSTVVFSDTPPASAAPPAHSVALSLGRSSSKADRALFVDDLFRDNVARALYMGLGKTLGK